MTAEHVADVLRAVCALAWTGAAFVFAYAELTLPAVIETAAGCVRSL